MSQRDPAGTAVANTLYRALAVLRVIVLVNSFLLYFYRASAYPRPVLGAVILVGLAFWTFFAVWAYGRPALRRAPLLLADLAVAVAAILATPLVKGEGLHATLPGFWVMGVVLAWAIEWRIVGGLAAAAAVVTADVLIRDHLTQTNYSNILLLLIGGLIVGFLSDLLQRTAAERDRAERAAAAAAERQRLGRVVHDGVLQVLALVQKRGAEIGGEAAELGRLAGEQEVALRAYVQREVSAPADGAPYDLGAALAALGSAHVSVAVPAGAVPVAAGVGVEVAAVVAECLSNVRHHVGRDAPAWVLLEDLGPELVVSVRDRGPGIDAGRLEQAAAEGRLGVASSIRGRVAELGGTADLVTSPSGTEWEFRVPRSAS
ncbi:MacS family sensor histidine kinase [Marmoricola sp. RAF53]|uniref:MacS family sensor histidine kinase n=1 Tax=Marmoricola sp. RAF53 TaxID=3233059 RepID=UPI003F94F8D8